MGALSSLNNRGKCHGYSVKVRLFCNKYFGRAFGEQCTMDFAVMNTGCFAHRKGKRTKDFACQL